MKVGITMITHAHPLPNMQSDLSTKEARGNMSRHFVDLLGQVMGSVMVVVALEDQSARELVGI